MMARGAQARVMRGTAAVLGRELEEEDEFDLSLSMPNNEKLTAAELPSPFGNGSSNYTAEEEQQFKERFEKTALGAAITKWKSENAATSASSSASSSSAPVNPAGKSGKMGFCDVHLYDVLEAVWLFYGGYVPPEIITAACSFGGIEDIAYPNWGCPVVADGDVLFADGYFADTGFDYFLAFGPTGYIDWKFNEYCECHQGYELGCAAKIPYPEYGPILLPEIPDAGDSQVAGPYFADSVVYPGDNHKKWLDYCKFVAIWNGDVTHAVEDDDLREDYTLALYDGLSKEVQECGCFFIKSAEGMVGECPGVSLFEYED